MSNAKNTICCDCGKPVISEFKTKRCDTCRVIALDEQAKRNYLKNRERTKRLKAEGNPTRKRKTNEMILGVYVYAE